MEMHLSLSFEFSKKDLSLHSFCKYVRGQLSCSHTVANISDVQTATCCFCSGSNSHTFLRKNITSIRYFLVFELLQRDRREHGDCSFQSTSKRLTYTDVTFSVFVVCTTVFFERKQILSVWFQNISSFERNLSVAETVRCAGRFFDCEHTECILHFIFIITIIIYFTQRERQYAHTRNYI